MPKRIAVTPTYATGDLARILEIEQRQIEDTVADLTEEQMLWRASSQAKPAIEILWHLSYDQIHKPLPATKAEALERLRTAYDMLQQDIATPGKLDEIITWWTGDTIPFRGFVWGMIRHRSFHLGELVYLRQVMGLDEPKYYHED